MVCAAVQSTDASPTVPVTCEVAVAGTPSPANPAAYALPEDPATRATSDRSNTPMSPPPLVTSTAAVSADERVEPMYALSVSVSVPLPLVTSTRA